MRPHSTHIPLPLPKGQVSGGETRRESRDCVFRSHPILSAIPKEEASGGLKYGEGTARRLQRREVLPSSRLVQTAP